MMVVPGHTRCPAYLLARKLRDFQENCAAIRKLIDSTYSSVLVHTFHYSVVHCSSPEAQKRRIIFAKQLQILSNRELWRNPIPSSIIVPAEQTDRREFEWLKNLIKDLLRIDPDLSLLYGDVGGGVVYHSLGRGKVGTRNIYMNKQTNRV